MTTATVPDITPHLALVRGKCRELLRQYAGYVELDDLMQEVHIWWLAQRPELLEEYLADPRKLRLRRAVWRAARDVAEKYRRQAESPDPYVQVRYSSAEIMQLLPVALDPEGIPDGGGIRDDGPRPHGNLAEGGDVLASLVDVRRALAFLSDDDHQYLVWLDGLRWNYELAGIGLNIAADSVRRRAARIGERLARWLNHESE